MKFRNQYGEHERYHCSSGCRDVMTYVSDENGAPVENGLISLYDEIQSHRESVELATLLQRYAMGDESALNKVQGIYADVVDAPKTFAEVFDLVKSAEKSFNGLPEDFRALFGDSPLEFWRQAGTPEFAETMARFDAEQKKNGSDNNNSDFNQSGNQTDGNGGNLSA